MYMRLRELVQKTSRCVLRRQFVSSATARERARASEPLFPFQSIPPERDAYEYLTSKKIHFLDLLRGIHFDSRSIEPAANQLASKKLACVQRFLLGSSDGHKYLSLRSFPRLKLRDENLVQCETYLLVFRLDLGQIFSHLASWCEKPSYFKEALFFAQIISCGMRPCRLCWPARRGWHARCIHCAWLMFSLPGRSCIGHFTPNKGIIYCHTEKLYLDLVAAFCSRLMADMSCKVL